MKTNLPDIRNLISSGKFPAAYCVFRDSIGYPVSLLRGSSFKRFEGLGRAKKQLHILKPNTDIIFKRSSIGISLSVQTSTLRKSLNEDPLNLMSLFNFKTQSYSFAHPYCEEAGESQFRCGQIFDWEFNKGVTSFG